LALSEEQILACEEEAQELAGPEIHEQEAAEVLVPLLKKIIVRNVRAELKGRSR
jgi:hypothetical protein